MQNVTPLGPDETGSHVAPGLTLQLRSGTGPGGPGSLYTLSPAEK